MTTRSEPAPHSRPGEPSPPSATPPLQQDGSPPPSPSPAPEAARCPPAARPQASARAVALGDRALRVQQELKRRAAQPGATASALASSLADGTSFESSVLGDDPSRAPREAREEFRLFAMAVGAVSPPPQRTREHARGPPQPLGTPRAPNPPTPTPHTRVSAGDGSARPGPRAVTISGVYPRF